MSVLASIVVGAVGFAITMSWVDAGHAPLAVQSPEVESVVPYPDRELPPEWQWHPNPGNYDSMYQGVKQERLDWIRNSGRR